MDAQVGGRPILLHRGENMLHRVSTSTSSRHRASPLCFPSWKPFTQPSPRFLSPSFSLSLSLKRLRVRLSVCPSTLYICVCGSRPFVLLAKPPTSSRPLHSSPSPSLSFSLSSFFPLQNFSGFYGARSSDSRTLVRTYRRTPVRDTDRRGLTSTHPPPPTPLSGVFDLNPGQWGRGNGPVYYRPVWKTLTPAADYGHTEG